MANDEAKLLIFRRILQEFIPPNWAIFERDGIIGICDNSCAPTPKSTEYFGVGLDLMQQAIEMRRSK